MTQASPKSTVIDLPVPGLGRAPRAGRPLHVRSFGLTHPGKVRPRNEDQFLVARLCKALQVQHTSLPQPEIRHSTEEGYLFLVADGMGGHAGGEKASALVVDTIESFVLNSFKWFFHLVGNEENEILAQFQAALRQADANLFAEAARHPELTGMGTTLTLAYSLDAELFIAHVGDSRCYLLRQGILYRMTRDHTMAEEMVNSGYANAGEDVLKHLRHVITNVVGGHEPGLRLEVHKLVLQPGDRLMLCSDGLTEMVSDLVISGILQAEADPRRACEQLTERANAEGGRDNITAVVAAYEPSA
jgi:protein phosphatase